MGHSPLPASQQLTNGDNGWTWLVLLGSLGFMMEFVRDFQRDDQRHADDQTWNNGPGKLSKSSMTDQISAE